MSATEYRSEIECRARAYAEQHIQQAFGSICRAFNLTDEGDRYTFNKATRAEVEGMLVKLIGLLREAPIAVNPAAFAAADGHYAAFMREAKRKPRRRKATP